MWNPSQYHKFSSERSRPFFDLIAQVELDDAHVIADLGCGTGRLTQVLSQRWSAAHVTGVDNSPEMLQEAAALQIPGRLEFITAEIQAWTCETPIDLILSNAALHWVEDHSALLKRLAGMLAANGVLAVQMPNRFGTATQTAIDETAADPRWRGPLRGAGLHRHSVMPLTWYVEALHDLGFTVNAWETTYLHVLTGEAPVLDWLKGTSLRPLLARLDAHQADAFLAALGARLKAAYPPSGDVTLFPFPRLFFVATRRNRQLATHPLPASP
jgi:trans-aconitate 2-methyltransferase